MTSSPPLRRMFLPGDVVKSANGSRPPGQPVFRAAVAYARAALEHVLAEQTRRIPKDL